MPLSDPLSVTWWRYARWARMEDWESSFPHTEEVLRRGLNALVRKGRMDPKVAKMMRDALYQGDPMLGPPIPGRVPADEHKARRERLLYGKPGRE